MVCKGWTVAKTTPYTLSLVPRPKVTQQRVDYITVTSVEKAYIRLGTRLVTHFVYTVFVLWCPGVSDSNLWFASRVLVCDTLQNLSKVMNSS